MCKEATFIWNSDVSEYVLIGNVRRTVKYQTIWMKKETVVDYGNEVIHLAKRKEKRQLFCYMIKSWYR